MIGGHGREYVYGPGIYRQAGRCWIGCGRSVDISYVVLSQLCFVAICPLGNVIPKCRDPSRLLKGIRTEEARYRVSLRDSGDRCRVTPLWPQDNNRSGVFVNTCSNLYRTQV